MNEETEKKINALAKLFYAMIGNRVPDGYKFNEAGHPQEKLMWNQAVIAHVFINQDYTLSKEQIS